MPAHDRFRLEAKVTPLSGNPTRAFLELATILLKGGSDSINGNGAQALAFAPPLQRPPTAFSQSEKQWAKSKRFFDRWFPNCINLRSAQPRQ